jgi:hypothetical protein
VPLPQTELDALAWRGPRWDELEPLAARLGADLAVSKLRDGDVV